MLLRCQKEKKIPPLPSSTQHLSLGDKLTSNCSAQPASSEHTSEELKASVCPDSILKIIAISQQPLHYYTFVKREILKRQKEHKRENARLEKSLHKQKMRHEFGIPSITPIICSWKKMHQAGRYISKRGQQGLDKKSH